MKNEIYIANLGKYNEGELVGKWIELPFTHQQLLETLEEIGINEEYEEFAIHDYSLEIEYEVGEYENISKLNENFKMIKDNNLDTTELNAILEAGYSLKEAITKMVEGSYNFIMCNNEEEFAEGLVDNGYLEVPAHLEMYIDYNAIARDYLCGNWYLTEYGAVEIF